MLLQFDPFRELDRFAEQTFNRTPAMPMDAVRRGETVHVFLDLPGVDPASIDLEVERNVLTVKAERRWNREEGDQVLASERRQGSFDALPARIRELVLGSLARHEPRHRGEVEVAAMSSADRRAKRVRRLSCFGVDEGGAQDVREPRSHAIDVRPERAHLARLCRAKEVRHHARDVAAAGYVAV